MVPKPQNVDFSQDEASASKVSNNNNDKEEKEIIRDEAFKIGNQVLGLEHHIFNRYYLGAAHIFGLYYLYVSIFHGSPLSLVLFELAYGYTGGLGITIGCHRYWTHKSFKATVPLQWVMMIMQTIGNQYPIHKWCLDHRIHHKYTDTNADPHNSKRGFWFSHMGWLLLPKHPDLQKKLKTFDMSDLEKDPIVRFQSKYYLLLMFVLNFLIPISIVHYFWQLSLFHSIASNYRRYLVMLHFTWSVNSLAHLWGDRPYDKNISSTNNPLVSILAAGEGWHNYHHTFPWDYKTSEFGWKLNFSCMVIDFWAWMGWAYDMKTVSPKLLQDRLNRTGKGSLTKSCDNTTFNATVPDVTELMKSIEEPAWGWDDNNIPEDLRECTKVLRPERVHTN